MILQLRNFQKRYTSKLLLLAKKRGIVKEIRSDMELLRKNGYRISDKLFEETLRKAGEMK